MVSKGIKTAQIIAAVLWAAWLGVVLLIMKFQDSLIPLIYGSNMSELSAERVLPLPTIINAAHLTALGIVSSCIVCCSRVSRTRLKAAIIALVYGLLVPVNTIGSGLLSNWYITARVATFGASYLAKYSILNNIVNMFSWLFVTPAAILFLFSLGRYFDAEKRLEAELPEVAE